jgi:cytochrome c
MSSDPARTTWLLVAMLSVAAGESAAAEDIPGGTYGLGTPAMAAQIASWNIDVRADGRGLPSGRGSVEQGAELYAQACVACHGPAGAGGPADRLVGGIGTLATAQPVKTVGSYWPYATTLFDYIRRAMPYNRPQSLTSDEVYALVAYLLNLNGIVPAGTTLDAESLRRVKMPNRHGFIRKTGG